MNEKTSSDQSIMDKSMRSVFGKISRKYASFQNQAANLILPTLFSFYKLVGNIPYEATEEKLKEIFSEVGPVLSLK